MTTPFPFTSGQVLTAAQMNAITTLPINDQTASYTLVVGDVGKRVIMNVASANTVTVNNSIFAAGDTIFIANKGAGVSTITAGAGVTINVSGSLALAQYGGGTLIALSASTFTFFPAGGIGAVPSSVEYLVIAGGGGGGGNSATSWGGGGGAGGYRNGVVGETTGGGGSNETPFSVTAGVTYTITVGNGGAAGNQVSGSDGSDSSIAGTGLSTITSTGGGGGGTDAVGKNGGSGGGGGGDNTSRAGGTRTASPVQGNNGAAGGASGFTAGGGGGAGAVGSGSTGGAGLSSSISGSAVTRGVGANGGITSPAAGTVNTGNGGQGRGSGVGIGGAGGKGVVIIRQPIGNKFPTTLTVGAFTATATHWVFTFNDSGTIGWS